MSSRRASTQQEGPGRAERSEDGRPHRDGYDRGASRQREVRSNLEWRLSPKVSVEGSYDNVNDISSSSLGNLGADIRWRLEFE